MDNYLPYIWLAAAVIFFVAEAATVQLVSIWFGIAALAAIIPAALKAPVWVQGAVFAAVSVILLIATRPLVRKILDKNKICRTNADSVIGTTAVVVEKISNADSSGRVKAGGLLWTARSGDPECPEIAEGEYVTVKKIDGVKLIVEKNGRTGSPDQTENQ